MTSHPIDLHVGQRLKLARLEGGLSQEAVAEKLGVTFQQVQKYERGINRVAASRLYQLSLILGRPVTWFFEELDNTSFKHQKHPTPPETYKLLAEFNQLSEPMQKILRTFIRNWVRAGG